MGAKDERDVEICSLGQLQDALLRNGGYWSGSKCIRADDF